MEPTQEELAQIQEQLKSIEQECLSQSGVFPIKIYEDMVYMPNDGFMQMVSHLHEKDARISILKAQLDESRSMYGKSCSCNMNRIRIHQRIKDAFMFGILAAMIFVAYLEMTGRV